MKKSLEKLKSFDINSKVDKSETPNSIYSTNNLGLQTMIPINNFQSNIEIINVKDFGVVGDGVTDDTLAIESVMSNYSNIYFPNGTYLVDYVNVYGDTTVNTANNVLFKQKPQALAGKRIMNILGSNVVIGNVNFEGNISTDIDEQNHAVFIISNATNGNLSNIRIGDVSVSDIRGDGFYVGATAGYRSSAISIGNVVVDNVYRNGVSITSGYDITIKTVTGNRVGFMIVDLETNAGQGTIEDVKISYVRGRCLGFIGTTATDYVDSVLVENVDLDPSYQGQSTPSYAVGVALKDGITLRNCKSVNLGTAKVSGFDRCGIYTVTGVGEIGIQNLNIDFLGITNCSLTDAVLNSYMELSNSNVNINNLDINLNNAKRGIQSLASGIFGYIKATAITGSSTIRSCSNLRIEYFNQTGDGIPINSCQKITINGGTIVGDRLASSSNFCIFNNVTATATSFLFTSATGENHLINNSTLNTDYYAFGTSFRNYTMPNRFGIIRQWFDSNGYARTKNSAPTSDTDGAFKVANGVNANDAVNKGQLDLKVDKITGKGLSTEDYTTAEKSKLASITAIFTTALQSSYDNAVNWITTNGTNLLNHLTNTSNPHSVTKSQVGLANVDNTSDLNKPISTATQTALNNKADLVGGLVPSSQLPSFVDDVLEFADLASFPTTGETGKIYIAIDSGKQYRWSGTNYIQITNGLIASTNDVPEGGSNLYFTTARVLATALSGLSLVTGGTIISTDTVLQAFGKIQKQINDLITTVNGKFNIPTGNSNQYLNGLGVPTDFSSNISGFSIGDFKQSVIAFNHENWILCNGQELLRSEYDVLFSLISTSFGSGNGTTTFNVPDLRGKVFGGIGQGIGLTDRTLGQNIGSENHILVANEIPSHNHKQRGYGGSSIGSGGALSTDVAVYNNDGVLSTISNLPNTENTGGGQAHNNMQPTLFSGNHFIKAK